MVMFYLWGRILVIYSVTFKGKESSFVQFLVHILKALSWVLQINFHCSYGLSALFIKHIYIFFCLIEIQQDRQINSYILRLLQDNVCKGLKHISFCYSILLTNSSMEDVVYYITYQIRGWGQLYFSVLVSFVF